METKKCIKCGKIKPIYEFYKHSKMSDGHLNKCKDCIRDEAHKRYLIKSKDEEWLEKERRRGRDKFKRLGYKGKFKQTRQICPELSNLSRRLKNMGFLVKGKDLHHWNYNKPYSVFILSKKAHKNIHRFITVNYEDKFCYMPDGSRIETEEEAKHQFSTILKNKGIKEKLILIDISKLLF